MGLNPKSCYCIVAELLPVVRTSKCEAEVLALASVEPEAGVCVCMCVGVSFHVAPLSNQSVRMGHQLMSTFLLQIGRHRRSGGGGVTKSARPWSEYLRRASPWQPLSSPDAASPAFTSLLSSPLSFYLWMSGNLVPRFGDHYWPDVSREASSLHRGWSAYDRNSQNQCGLRTSQGTPPMVSK